MVELIGRADCSVVTELSCQPLANQRTAAELLLLSVGSQTKFTVRRCRTSLADDPFSATKSPLTRLVGPELKKMLLSPLLWLKSIACAQV